MPRDQPTDPPDVPQPAAPDQPREHAPTIQSQDGDRRLADLELRPDGPSAWDTPGITDHPDRPRPDSIRLTPDRLAHILDGDPVGDGGGHLHGTGRPGKTEFPPDWDEDRIAAAVLHTARKKPDTSNTAHGSSTARTTR